MGQPNLETPYDDRIHAGRVLAERLGAYRGKNVLVLGIPRGGVPVAAEVARRLDADLDVIVARKLGAPGQPELAVGAVTANGEEFLNEAILRTVGASAQYLELSRKEQIAEARRREARFRGGRPAQAIQDRVVILVDDGLATGATMRAAIRSVRRQRPAWLVVAVPVGSEEAYAALQEDADDVICASVPERFVAIGFFYQRFEPTEDAEVESILREFSSRREVRRLDVARTPAGSASCGLLTVSSGCAQVPSPSAPAIARASRTSTEIVRRATPSPTPEGRGGVSR